MRRITFTILSLFVCLLASAQLQMIPFHGVTENRTAAASNVPDEAIGVGYCSSNPADNKITLIGTGGESDLATAIQFSAAELKAKGNKIYMIKFFLGSDKVDNLKVFVKNSLTGANLVEQAVADANMGWNSIALDTPFDYSNETGDIYLGYSMTAAGYPIALELSTMNKKADWASINNGAWDNLSNISDFRNMVLMIQAIVTGGDYSAEKVQLGATPAAAATEKPFVETDTPIEAYCDVLNNGVKTIRSLELSYEVNGEKKTASYDNLAIVNSMMESIELPDFQISAPGKYELNVSITKVNGEKNVNDYKEATVAFEALAKGSFTDRRIYIEQFTGQGCPYCPLGHDALDNAIIGYEDRVSIVAHYSYDGKYGELYADANSTIARQFGVNAAPMCMIDRTKMPKVTNDLAFNTQILTPTIIADMVSKPAYVKLDVNGVYDKNSKAFEVTVAGEFLKDFPNAKLNIFLTEDDVTAYQAHANYGIIDAFEHNHIMRAVITDYEFGDNIKAEGNKFEATYKYQIPEAFGKINKEPHTPVVENLKVVVFVADFLANDRNNCNVHNSATVSVTDFQEGVVEGSSIENINAAANLDIRGGNGMVMVNGEYDALNLYTIDGMEVANENLNKGLYIVKATVGKSVVTKKVVVE